MNAITGSPLTSNVSKIFERDGNAISNWKLKINNQMYPNYSADKHDALMEILKVSNNLNDILGGVDPQITSANFPTSYWLCGASLSLPNENSDRFVSGLNSEGSAVEIEFQCSSNESAVLVNTYSDFILVKMTSMLNVYAGKQLELID